MPMLIKLSAKHIEETQKNKVRKHEMMGIRIIMMGETVTVQVLSLAGFEMGDHQQHQINDHIAHLDIIKIMRLILKIELLDEEMVIGPQMKNAMMTIKIMTMAVAQSET